MLDILAPVRHVHSWQGSPRYAAELAALVQGSLTGLYALEPLTAAPKEASPGMLAEVIEFLREMLDTAKRAGPDFQRWARDLGVHEAQWRAAQGSLPQMLAATAPWHDLVVMGADAQSTWESPGGLAELLLGLRQACVVVPPDVEHLKLDTVVMAWNGAAEGTRAIRSARPLLQHARRRILLQARVPAVQPPLALQSMSDYLERRGLTHELHRLDAAPGDAGEAILREADAVDADLLVMGAYGRSRFSEWVLGGATRAVLAQARMPVLLQH
ncbi:universal stress protein [Tahibacter caeni]|uniref:universal stress protein n=1 Tax=Tahibacter caeni TaxID=1453545 RepID=UPI0021483BAA|nr:universal stress protein [Tahibacter caeni]